MINNTNSEGQIIKQAGWKTLLEQYNELVELHSSWKETIYKHLTNSDEAEKEQEEADYEADVFENYDLDYIERHGDYTYFNDEDAEEVEGDEDNVEYLDNSDDLVDEDIRIDDATMASKDLAKTLEKISTAITFRDPSQISFLFDEAEKSCRFLGIEYYSDHEMINDALSITRIRDTQLIYTPPKPTLIIPSLIIPTEAYLISLIQKDPKLIFGISPRQFEELIAELFHNRGFDVELTQATRDGGRDIIAIYETLDIQTKYLIECKRYAPSNKVSLSIVQRLFGVKTAEPANKAILVTTSSYTKDAKAFASDHIWDLELKAYDDIMSWVKKYNNPDIHPK
jgi:hypothetical protein